MRAIALVLTLCIGAYQSVAASSLSVSRAYTAQVFVRGLQEQTALVSSHLGCIPNESDWPAILLAPQGNCGGTWRGPYINVIPLDPWGREYVYRRNNDPSSPEDFLIYSTGANGIDDGGQKDDISSADGFDSQIYEDRKGWSVILLVLVGCIVLGLSLGALLRGGAIGRSIWLRRFLNVSPLIVVSTAYLLAGVAVYGYAIAGIASAVLILVAIVYAIIGLFQRRVIESIVTLLLLVGTSMLFVPAIVV